MSQKAKENNKIRTLFIINKEQNNNPIILFNNTIKLIELKCRICSYITNKTSSFDKHIKIHFKNIFKVCYDDLNNKDNLGNIFNKSNINEIIESTENNENNIIMDTENHINSLNKLFF